MVASAARQDAITLFALAAVDVARREAALTRLAELSPPPDAEIDVASALVDPAHLATWRQDVLEIYFGLWSPRSK